MSRYELTRWSGLAGLVSGLLIIAGAIALQFTEPIVTGTLFASGHILLFFLLSGVYSVQYSATGYVGLLGYVIATVGNALLIAAAASFMLSRVEIAEEIFPVASPVTGILFAIGLLLLALSNSRVRALPSWPGWLMFVGIALDQILVRLPGDLPQLALAAPTLLLGLGVAGFGWVIRKN
ncbi:MAG: hypothetical protein ACE5JF_01870 [Anaerolineales bacterium]